MRTKLSLFGSLFLAVLLAGCAEDFVNDVDPLIDQIEDELLTNETQVPFLITGVQGRWSSVSDNLGVIADGLSDHFFFDTNVVGATFPTFDQIDDATISTANNSVDGVYQGIHGLRLLSDTLLTRLDQITFEDADLEKEARFTGHFYGGVARYYLASYFGLAPGNPGSPLFGGPMISSSDLYDMADAKLVTAATFANDFEKRVINTLRARIALYQGDYSGAASLAANGLAVGESFDAAFNDQSTNAYWSQAGRGRSQYAVADKVVQFIRDDAGEAARIPIYTALGNDDETTYFFQDKYPLRSTDMPFVTGGENALIRAEAAVRAGDEDGARDFISAIRTAGSLTPLADTDTVDLAFIEAEREKELFAMGLRVLDQRRFGTFHIPNGWAYFPITQSERNQNQNL